MAIGNIHIHIIEDGSDSIVGKKFVSQVPRTGDEIRLAGPDNERFYTVTRVVWAYDEDGPFERANVGVALSANALPAEGE